MKHRNLGALAIVGVVGVTALALILQFPDTTEPDPAQAKDTEFRSGDLSPDPVATSEQQASWVQASPEEDALTTDPASQPAETRPFSLISVFRTNTFYYLARNRVVTRFGEFIRDLPLSAAQKQEVRRLMVEVDAHNVALGQRLRNGEISQQEYQALRIQMDEELATILSPDQVETYREAERQSTADFRQQMADNRSRTVNSNLQRISGLTEANRELFLDKLIGANGGRPAQNFYDDAVLNNVRNELAQLFDSDQLEVIDIYIESERARRAQIEAISQGIQDNDAYSFRYLTNARNNISSSYGEFIRDLPLTPEQKQEIRTLMVNVTARNADLREARSNDQISASEMSSRYLNMEAELAEILDDSGMQAYREYEQQRLEAVSQTALERQQQMLRRNLRSISGLTEDNWLLFTEALATVEPVPSSGFRFKPESIQQARDQVAGSFDSDQLEIVDIYLAESMAFQRNLEERRQERSNN